jgi:DNA-binding IclR family transcriptional regulator
VKDSGARALKRGLQILRALQQAGPAGTRVADIAAVTGVPRPTVYRLLRVLEEERFVSELPQGKLYVRGSPARPPSRWKQLTERVAPRMRRIVAVTGSSSFLVRRSGNDSLCLHREFGTFPIQFHAVPIGGRRPLGVGAAGLALLAALDDDLAEAIILGNEEQLSLYRGMTCSTMRQLVRNTRARGYAVVGNYAVPGILGVGVALRNERGEAIAGVSVTSTVERMPTSSHASIATLIERELARK